MLNSLFSDHMVLQRNKPIVFFGDDKDGRVVEIQFNGYKKNTSVKEGKWKICFDPLSAGGPFEIHVSNGFEKRILKDVVIGDVFLAAGQSNMEFLMKNTSFYDQELSQSIPEVRYYFVNQVEYEKDNIFYPEFKNQEWKIVDSSNLGDVSAIAYYFAKKVMSNIDVPIGIVGCHKGGTSASCWIGESYLECNQDVWDAYVKSYWDDIQNQTEEQEDMAIEAYKKEYDEYQLKVARYLEMYPENTIGQMKQDIGHTPWPAPKGRKDFGRPSGLHETMFERINSFSFGSVLWYQGEEDTKLAELYESLLTLLIRSWREELQDDQLPFYLVQLPEYNDYKGEFSWAVVRDAQQKVAKNLSNVEIVCSLGCGEEFNIHPVDKSVLGERLADLVLETYYCVPTNGKYPTIDSVEYNDGQLECIVCNLYDQKLVNTGDEKLEISFDGITFEEIDVEIFENRILANVSKKPLSIRYAWKNYPKIGFYRMDGKPLFPYLLREVNNE